MRIAMQGFKGIRVWIEIAMIGVLIWLMFVSMAHADGAQDQQRINQSDETRYALQRQWNQNASDKMVAIEKHLDNTDMDVKELASDMEKIFGGLITLATLAGANLVVQFKKKVN